MLVKLKTKYNNMAVPVRAAMWFMLCSIIPQVITVIMTAIFTRILSTNDYGISSNYSAWYNIFSIFITLNLNCGVYNNAMLKYEDKRDEYTSSMMGLSLLLGIAGLTIIMLFHTQFSKIMTLPFSLLVCLALQCLFYNPYGCWMSRVKYEYNYKSLIKITLLVSILSPLLSVVFILFSENKAVGKVWGQNVIYIILGIVFYILAFSKSRKLYHKEYWTFALRFNLPLIPHYLSLVLLNQSDRVMITAMCGAAANGLYSVGYAAASLLLILNSGLTQALTPWCYSSMRDKQFHNTKKYISIICVVYAGIDLLFIMLAPEAIYFLAGSKYAQAVYVIPPVATSMYLIFLYNIYSIFEFFYEKTKPVMVCSTLSAVMNIALNYYFIPRHGFLAAGYTTLVCYLVNALLHVIVLRKVFNQQNGSIYAVSIKNTFGIGLVQVFISIAITALYPYTFVRWSIFAVVLVVAIIKRDFFLKLLKTIKK
ncbi:MAG: hypothetical protein EOM34_08985 [Clostridia bacterium]|nr:hypothetical protein [Clostridia bacterium]